MLHLGTAVTEDYVEAARSFLSSLQRVSGVSKFCVTPGYDWIERDKPRFPGVDFHPLPLPEALDCCDPDFLCMQHGTFLDALTVDEDDVVLLIDGTDVVLQRDLTPIELDMLENLGEEAVAVGWNGGPGDTLRQEWDRLNPKAKLTAAEHAFGELGRIPVYNCGVLAMRARTWDAVRATYIEAWRSRPLFGNPRCCQFLLCWCFHALGLAVEPLSPAFHSHNHFIYEFGPEHWFTADGLLHWRTEKVFARHTSRN